tara:strand:- start:353 stop:3274 length:2922 start_codon:yes stop_codon:yes gene_type:complete
MSAEGYTQTYLLDANRLSSEEYSASNLSDTSNALFTNKVSNGITLDIGDKVSIESAHIAQRGAGGEVIQFNGTELGETTISTTKTTNASYIGTTILSGTFFYSPTGYAYETSNNEEEQIKIKDNEASVTFEYYKNTNGENNIGLPRNFGSASQGTSVHGGDPTAGGGFTNGSFWNASDSYAKGLNTYYSNASHIFVPDYLDVHAMNACGASCIVRKLKQDNSKYTLFKRNEIVWSSLSVSASTTASFLRPSPSEGEFSSDVLPDPAIGGYNRYRQTEKISSKIGYNSPSTIASDITNELISTDPPINIGLSNDSLVINSTLNKAFPCANWDLFSNVANKNFFNASLKDGLPVGINGSILNNFESANYLSNYAYVGFKRPDFVEAGRALGGYRGTISRNTVPLSGSGTAMINTGILWNSENLQKVKRFFESQRLYPELLDEATITGRENTNYALYNTTSASLNASFRQEARFLHYDLCNTTKPVLAPIGGDEYNVSFSTTSRRPPRTSASETSSVPLFVYFNNNSSHLSGSDTQADSDDNLAFGFARKLIDGGREWIGVTTERIGGIPTSYFGEQGGSEIKAGTKIGYDYHFRGYGNSAIILNSGYNPLQYYGQQEFTSARYIRQVYLGANKPLLNFNTAQARFEISNLHSAEKIGNFFNAGDPNSPATVFAPPASSEASLDCYKINKPLRYDTWTPDLQPYPIVKTAGGTTKTTQNNFVEMNPMFESSKIYDAHGGVSIVDMGSTESLWDQSIWGLLGFQYGQFNSSGNIEDIDNINIRFTDDTLNTSGITTNADVTSVNSQQFSVNAFGINMFNPLVNSNLNYYNASQSLLTVNAKTPDFVVEPPIIISGISSTAIRANKLPRKILRGYFLLSSDLLDNANYYQTANPMSVMAVTGKYNAENDFVEYSGGGAVFTVTRKKTITSIRTQITDPEGSLAQVGDNSGVIYRVDKQINTDLNFATNVASGMYNQKK